MNDFEDSRVRTQYGAPPPRRRWYRWLAVGMALTVAFALLIVSVILLTDRSGRPDRALDVDFGRRTAFAQWWDAAYPDVSALQAVVDEAQRSLRLAEPRALTSACQTMHDVAAVRVPAHLPAPEGDLSAELGAAATDAHAAAHMCLSVVERTPNNYDAEFLSNLEQADRQVKAAMATANEYLAGFSGQPGGP